LLLQGCSFGMSSGDGCYGYRFSVVGCLGVSFRGMFILVGLSLMEVDRRDIFVGVYFRVFRLYTAPFSCTFFITSLCSSSTGI